MKPVAWIKIRELSYMKAVAEHGKYDWQTNLGLKPEPDDEGLSLPRRRVALAPCRQP